LNVEQRLFFLKKKKRVIYILVLGTAPASMSL
jgi:hypothetical protein